MITSIKNKLYRWKYLIILSFLFVIILSVHTIVSFDIGFHLKAGEYIVKSRQVPQHDPFSHTVSDHPYIDSHWLFQLFLFTVYSLLGTGGIIVCKTIIFVVTFVILFRIGYKSGNYILSVLFISLCAFIVSERSIARPEIMTFLFLASYLFILHNYKYKKSKLLYLIPILQILWVNMHGLFVLGIALMIIYCAGELILRRFRLPLEWNDEYALKGKSYFLLLAVTFLSIIACFLTPYGHKGLFYALNLFTEIGEQASLHMKNIDELVPPFSKYMPNLYRIVSFYKILICVSIITFLLNFKRLKLTYFLIYCAFFYLSLLANRNIALFAIVSMPIMVINTDSAFPQIWPFSGRRARYAAKIAEGILAIFMVVVIFNLISNGYYATNRIAKRFGTGVSGLTNPKGAIRFIKEADIKGNVFNSVNFGGYFIWKCYPERKVFVDGRWELYGDDFLNDYYFSLINDRAFESLTGYYDINYALVDSQIALCERLYRDKNWKLIYFDEIAAIFIRDIPLNNGIIEKYYVDLDALERDAARKPEEKKKKSTTGSLSELSKLAFTHFNKGNFFAIIGLHALAEREYNQVLINTNLYRSEIYNSLGLLYSAREEDEKAIGYFKEVIPADPDFVQTYYYLGFSYMKLGMIDQAIEAFQRAVSIRNNFAEAHGMLGVAYSKKGFYDKAERELAKTMKLDPYAWEYCGRIGDEYLFQERFDEALRMYMKLPPKFPRAYYKMAFVYHKKGDNDKAIDYLKQHLTLNPKDVLALARLSDLYYREGLYKEAESEYKKALRLAPDDPQIKEMGEMFSTE